MSDLRQNMATVLGDPLLYVFLALVAALMIWSAT